MTRVSAFILTVFACVSSVLQYSGFPQTQDPAYQLGIPPGSTITGGPDVVSLSNLGVHFEVPVHSKTGRGMNFSFNMNFDSSSYSQKAVPGGLQWSSLVGSLSTGGLNGLGAIMGSWAQLTCRDQYRDLQTYDQYTFTAYQDSEGTTHPFAYPGLIVTNRDPTLCMGKGIYPYGTTTGIASDGSGISMTVFTSFYGNFVTLPNGTVITPPTVAKYNGSWQAFGTGTKTDSNGNQVTETMTGTQGQPLSLQLASVTDTLGTVVLTTSGTYPNPVSYTYPTSTGSASWTQSFRGYTVQTAFNCPGISEFPATGMNLLDKISLPDGTYYQFTYEPTSPGNSHVTGRVASIRLPAGGTISYQYIGGDSGTGVACLDGSTSGMYRTTPDGTWTYLRSNITTTGSMTTVTDPQGNQTIVQFSGQSVPNVHYETQRQVYAGSATGTPLETTITCYGGTTPMTSCPASTVTSQSEINVYRSLNGGPYSRVDTFYNTYGQVTEKDDYDFGATTPTRKTLTTYDTSLGNGIMDRPATVKVMDGTGTVLEAEADYTYDEDQSSLVGSGWVQHVGVTCGTGYTKCRGNLTTRKKHVTQSSTVTETFTHYTSGQVYRATDANGNVTTNTYGACSGSLLSSVAMPLTLSTSYQWDCNGGVQTQVTDSNGKSTITKYADPLWRATEVDAPDGGVITTTYNDTASPPNVIHTQKISGTVVLTKQTNVDGYGRAVLHKLTTDPEGATYSTVGYDSLGRTYQVSTPYRSTSDTTYGVTTTHYDALGRSTTVIQSDNSQVTTSYSQNCTTVTDEAGKARRSCSDGLGRLIRVWEDPASLDYETDYQYDPLGNLLCVHQKGTDATADKACTDPTVPSAWRPRTLTYDMLSRLLTSYNPESGNMSYTYDNNGNVHTKTAPKPNQTGTATVVTTYTYDALNRLTGKSYSDGSTAPVQYSYDGASLTGCVTLPPAITGATNLLGRRSSMCDASGATSWTYDPLGRPLMEKRTIQGTTAITNSISYTYNLDGSLATLIYPSGRMITYTPSGAGRILSAVDVADGINYVTAATYSSHGAITGAINGAASGFTGVAISNAYNKRLQPVVISAAAPSATIVSFSFDFHLGAGDNGDVFQIVNNRDNNRTQNFQYDSINRISQAYTSGSSPLTSSWGEAYTIDPWGNLTNRTAVAGKTNTESLNAGPANILNQLPGFSYDAAGNLTQNGTAMYNYDAENRLITTAGWTYVYDGDGQRVRKSNSGSNGTLYWLGSGSNVLLETSVNGTATEEYVFFGGKRIARRDVSTGAVHYYFSDHLGSASVITSSTGTIQKESDYYPYGGELPVSGSDSNNYKFTGKERDSESGLDNFGARYDASAIARFTSPDAKLMSSRHLAFPQKWNKYAYVQNNPLLRVDPDGLDDYVVVRPAATTSNANWDAARAAVLKNPANTFTMLTGEKATVEAWQKATSTPGTHATFVGHTSHGENPDGSIGKTNAVVLNDGRSAGQKGSQTITVTPGAKADDPPTLSVKENGPGPQTKADTVAVFGCQSSDLSGQYGNANFVGMDSGKDNLSSLGALDAAGAAFVTGQANGQDAVGQANTAFQQNAVVNDVVNDKDGDHVEKTKDEDVKSD
jgi:RHS repeat-associated protein